MPLTSNTYTEDSSPKNIYQPDQSKNSETTHTRKSRELMVENSLPAHLAKRIEELQGRETTYIEDELFSEEALTNLQYREALERAFKLDPLSSP